MRGGTVQRSPWGDSRGVAREFGMTKNTLNYHIKNAVRKILRKYLSS